MAGIIVFHNGDWDSSGGAFRSMAAGVIQHLQANDAASAVKDSLESAVNSWLYFMDVAGAFSPEMIHEFLQALDRHIESARSQDAKDSYNPELYPGYLKKLAELREKLNAAISIPK